MVPNSENVSEFKIVEPITREFSAHKLVSNLTEDEGIITFEYKALFNVKYWVEVSIEKEEELIINFNVKLARLVQICVALIIFIAFFSSFSMSGFLWFSAIFTLIFYVGNILFLDSAIQKLIKSTAIYKRLNPNVEAGLSEEQLKWMNNVNKCPACGENIFPYDQNCPDCGLKLPRKATIKPFDISKYQSKRISYSYKPSKKKND